MKKANLIEFLREETRKKNPLVPKTIRLPEHLLLEVLDFLVETRGIDQSVVLRTCLINGWEDMKKTIYDE